MDELESIPTNGPIENPEISEPPPEPEARPLYGLALGLARPRI